MVKVAINGFGRIGRLAFRQMFAAPGYDVVAINDLTSPKMLAQLLKYDTTHGGYQGIIGEKPVHTVTYKDAVYEEDGRTVKVPGSITVDGKEITIYAKPNAAELPWGELGVDVVLECTGFYTSKAKSMAHIQAGIMQTIHAYTGDQMILDGPQRKGNLRRSRAGACNITPASSGAAKAIGLVLPELNGKLIGAAQRVPVPDGSTTLLYAVVKGKDVTVESVNAAMKAEANESFGYNEEEIVSSDILGMRYGSLFDATQTMVVKLDDDTYEVQVVSWYDNENSYTSQMVRTIKYFAELG